jgi:hypothetical protein
MLKILTVMISLGVTLSVPPTAAIAQTGYGVSNSAPSTSTFDRAWNHANEGKERARAGAAYVRHHGQPGYHHSHYHYDR